MLTWIKIMKFDFKLITIDFFPNTVDFTSTDQLTEQKCDPKLET